jgi:acetyl-CoA carboxylase biotin carboxyl carrier protein
MEADRMELQASHGVLAAACESVHRLMSFSDRPLLKITVRIGEVSVELDWPADAMAADPPEAASPGAAASPGEVTDPAAHLIRAGMVGVFYRSPEPGAKPFVQPGDLVIPGQQVAIIEAMKIMIPVEADRGGLVSEIHISDGQSVEFGTGLITITAGGAG